VKAIRLTHHLPIADVRPSEVEAPTLGPGEVLVRLKAAGLNHRDLWLFDQPWDAPFILGSDGAGVLEAFGPGAEAAGRGLEPGQAVVINPTQDWGDREDAYGPQFTILGYPRDGTLAEAIAMPVEYIFPGPAHLTWEEAAALPLAGVTAYRAVAVRGRAQAGEKVLVHGIGGGVALFALQFARLLGAQVMVTSTSDEKLERARALGADLAVNSRSGDWERAAREWTGGAGLDLVVESVGGELFARSLYALRLGGRVVTYGTTADSFARVDVETLYWNQLSVIGSTMGSPSDFAAMLKTVEQHGLKPVVDSVWPLAETHAALQRMAQGRQFGKIVVTCE
jgi:NADPH:quinone reductase-like Zn-dependent oxidoreductase